MSKILIFPPRVVTAAEDQESLVFKFSLVKSLLKYYTLKERGENWSYTSIKILKRIL